MSKRGFKGLTHWPVDIKWASVIDHKCTLQNTTQKRETDCKVRENDSVFFINDGHDLVSPYLLFTSPPVARRQNA